MSRRILATLAAAALAATTFIAPAASAQTAVNCSQNKFAAGGYPATQVVPAGYKAIPTPGGLFPWERGGYDVGQKTGAENAVQLLDAFALACPGVPIVIKGHSYGAAIVSTALETIQNRAYSTRVTVDLTGNPRKVGGIEDTLRGRVLPGMNNRGPAVYDVSKFAAVSDRCNARDGICNLPPRMQNPVGHFLAIIGYFTGAHRYPATPVSPAPPSTDPMSASEALRAFVAPAPSVAAKAPAPAAAPAPSAKASAKAPAPKVAPVVPPKAPAVIPVQPKAPVIVAPAPVVVQPAPVVPPAAPVVPSPSAPPATSSPVTPETTETDDGGDTTVGAEVDADLGGLGVGVGVGIG